MRKVEVAYLDDQEAYELTLLKDGVNQGVLFYDDVDELGLVKRIAKFLRGGE